MGCYANADTFGHKAIPHELYEIIFFWKENNLSWSERVVPSSYLDARHFMSYHVLPNARITGRLRPGHCYLSRFLAWCLNDHLFFCLSSPSLDFLYSSSVLLTSLVLSDLILLGRIVHFKMFHTHYVHWFPQFPWRQTLSLLFPREKTDGRSQCEPSSHKAGWRENQSYHFMW